MASAPVRLECLDHGTAATFAATAAGANLGALELAQPQLAASLSGVALPASWQPAETLDGWHSIRVEASATTAGWLDATAAPLRRARGLLREVIAEGNVALPSIAAGAELRLLLDRLGPHQAVFVFEEDLTRLAAVLRLHDVSREIGAGRVVFLVGDAAGAALAEYLRAHPGVLPPAKIVGLPTVAVERTAAVRELCERAGAAAAAEREPRLAAASARLSVSDAPDRRTAEPRLAVLALRAVRADHAVARQLAGGAAGLGWRTEVRVLATPSDAHTLPHLEALAALRPQIAIGVNQPSNAFALPSSTAVFRWHTNLLALPTADPGPEMHLAASPRVRRALSAAGVPQQRLADLYFAAAAESLEGRPGPIGDEVVLIADRPDASAEAGRIVQPTHKMLWSAARECAQAAFAAQRRLDPAGLLGEAERRSDVTLREPWLREPFLRLIEHNLIPAVLAGRIASGLAELGCTLRRIGRGWGRSGEGPGETWADDWTQIDDEAQARRPRAAVFVPPPEGLSAALLDAAARGWPLWVYGTSARELCEALGGVLEPRAHFEPFDSLPGLRAVLKPDVKALEARVESVRRHLAARHCYTHRLAGLRAMVESAGR